MPEPIDTIESQSSQTTTAEDVKKPRSRAKEKLRKLSKKASRLEESRDSWKNEHKVLKEMQRLTKQTATRQAAYLEREKAESGDLKKQLADAMDEKEQLISLVRGQQHRIDELEKILSRMLNPTKADPVDGSPSSKKSR